ncbi:uncharacterized protein LOC143628216 [Bidens hawaiensis]|uniref:uncharacterized protein LOC143628216 n=1 Tax=Bidens hawaiensis TaxID=980011 RepID=UPI004049EAE2
MLDGLLGRNAFTSKCKSLIKPTRTRITVLRRREEAKQRFLKEDLAKLLANGLDVNAYGRTEEFIAGMNLLACYTFIDQSCEYILKQLSVMQKLGQCPEECRETVASLMFAAARFSDLPELRDLRDLFQERYGNGLECYVNQVFVEKLESKPPVVEKRIKLLQDIATELSIRWDSKAFKQRMDKPTLAQALGSLSGDDYDYKPPKGNNTFRKNDHRSKERVEQAHQVPKLPKDETLNVKKKDVLDSPALRREEKYHKERTEHRDNGYAHHRRKEVSDIPNVETNKKHGYKHEPETIENNIFGNNDRGRKERHGYKHEPETMETRDNHDHLSKGRHKTRSPTFDDDRVAQGRKERCAHKHELETVDSKDNNASDGSVLRREEKHHRERIYHHDDGNAYGRRKEVLDVPYVETHKKHVYKHEPETIENNIIDNNDRGRKDRHGYKHESETTETRDKVRSPTRDKEDDERSTEIRSKSKSTYNSSLPPPYVKSNIPPPYSKPHNPSNLEKMKEPEHDIIQLPKPKSVRRKHRHRHSKSSSSHDDIGSSEDVRIVKRISSSRRKDRKGLQILFDDDQYRSHRDDEEKMMDKLLLHYSKKTSSGYDITELRKKKTSSSHHNDVEMIAPPARSISLPHESGEAEPKKVYARANSFQPDNQVKHVHPKLPDYDDLAARFAALRGR